MIHSQQVKEDLKKANIKIKDCQESKYKKIINFFKKPIKQRFLRTDIKGTCVRWKNESSGGKIRTEGTAMKCAWSFTGLFVRKRQILFFEATSQKIENYEGLYVLNL